VNRRRALANVAVLVSALTLGSCSGSAGKGDASTATTSRAHREVLVSIGSSATFGDGLDDRLRDAWPQRLYNDAFPISTVFVNAADRLLTVERALGRPLSIALEVHATVAVVWLGDLDLVIGVEPSQFESRLDRLVKRLRDSGARVLVGNFARERPGAVAYDDAISRVAAARGATLVDLASALASDPDVGPSTEVGAATSRAIAAAFGAALARS
jgi:GDSL-like Lipase/Acylhydrolase family